MNYWAALPYSNNFPTATGHFAYYNRDPCAATYVPKARSDFADRRGDRDTISRRNVRMIGTYALAGTPHCHQEKDWNCGPRKDTTPQPRRRWKAASFSPSADRRVAINPLSQCARHNYLTRTQMIDENKYAFMCE